MNTPELMALLDSVSHVRYMEMPDNDCVSHLVLWKAQMLMNFDMMINEMTIDINELRHQNQNLEYNENDNADMLEFNILRQEISGNTDGLLLWIEQQFHAGNMEIRDLVRSYSTFEGWNEMLFMDGRSYAILYELSNLRNSLNITFIDLSDE